MREQRNFNLDPVKESNKKYHEAVEYYKKIAEDHRKHKKYPQPFAYLLYTRIRDYMEKVADNGKPVTVSGMILASGMSVCNWYYMKEGKFDHELYSYMDSHDLSFDECEYYDGIPCAKVDDSVILLVPFSEIIEKAMLMHENETETRLYEKGRVGDIFALKSQHHWQEEKQPQTVNQTLVIANEEQARKAIEMLK